MKMPRLLIPCILLTAGAVLSLSCCQTAVQAGEQLLSLDLGDCVKMEFVLIPAGSFLMGSENSHEDEKPVRKLTITKPFYFGKYEATQEQRQSVMGTSPQSGNTVAMRGGSWSHDARDLWSSLRFGRFNRDFRFRSIGVRLVAVEK